MPLWSTSNHLLFGCENCDLNYVSHLYTLIFFRFLWVMEETSAYRGTSQRSGLFVLSHEWGLFISYVVCMYFCATVLSCSGHNKMRGHNIVIIENSYWSIFIAVTLYIQQTELFRFFSLYSVNLHYFPNVQQHWLLCNVYILYLVPERKKQFLISCCEWLLQCKSETANRRTSS